MADRRKGHGLQDDDSCALCAQATETIDHLLVTCPFSKQIWFKTLHKLGWDAVSPDAQDSKLVDWWIDVRKKIQKDSRHCFDSLIVLVCWLL
jgi:hypothetical protein